ncbi:zinc-binding dehydrogenase [Citrobacter koseri]|nr:zinc-binding dehydrogenase [Citrobacter koseri]
MSDEPSYSQPVEIDGVMVGGTVSRVVESSHPDYRPGEWVLSYSGWQDYDISDGKGLVKLGDNPEHPSWALGVLGMPGFTAYMGLLDIGQPKAGETLVVAAATGPVGATVGQIGKLKGCHVVVSQAAQKNAATRPRFSVLTYASITTRRILRNNWRKPARRELMCIMKMSAARCLMRFCRC